MNRRVFNHVETEAGRVRQFTAKGWIMERHVELTAVIHGAPKLGKPPLAECLAAAVAPLHASSSSLTTPGTHFILASTADVLPRNRLTPGIPIVLDEFNPSAPRGARPPHNTQDVKIITDTNGGTLNGRGGGQGGYPFPPGVPAQHHKRRR